MEKNAKKSNKSYCNVYIPPPARKMLPESKELANNHRCIQSSASSDKRHERKQTVKKSNRPLDRESGSIVSHLKMKNENNLSTKVKDHEDEEGYTSSPNCISCDKVKKEDLTNVKNMTKTRPIDCSKTNLNVQPVIEINDPVSNEICRVSELEQRPGESVCSKLVERLSENHIAMFENVLKVSHDRNINNFQLGAEYKSDLSINMPAVVKDHPYDKDKLFRDAWEKLLSLQESGSSSDVCGCERKIIKNRNFTKGKEVTSDGEVNERCIIEIYDFPAEFKTRDLLAIFSSYVNRGFQMRWVDDTHALGVFTSEIVAYEVLNTDLPLVLTRSLNEATYQSKEKAKQLMPPPPPPRPKTCSALARRLVSGALGIKPVFTQAEIEGEKEILVAREQKMAAKHRESV